MPLMAQRVCCAQSALCAELEISGDSSHRATDCSARCPSGAHPRHGGPLLLAQLEARWLGVGFARQILALCKGRSSALVRAACTTRSAMTSHACRLGCAKALAPWAHAVSVHRSSYSLVLVGKMAKLFAK